MVLGADEPVSGGEGRGARRVRAIARWRGWMSLRAGAGAIGPEGHAAKNGAAVLRAGAGTPGPDVAGPGPGSRVSRTSLALAVVREHPRHVVLAALAGRPPRRPGGRGRARWWSPSASPRSPQRPRPAALAAAAVLAGATLADARLAALDAGVLAHLHGRSIETRAIVLEPVRDRVRGPSVARVRLLDGLRRGRAGRSCAPGPGHAATHGRRPGERWGDSGQGSRAWRDRRRGGGRRGRAGAGRAWGGGHRGGVRAGGAARVRGRVSAAAECARGDRRAARGRRPGSGAVGSPGGWTGCGGGPRPGSGERLAAPEAALLRGMVLGADERLSDEVKRRLPGVRARAHPGGVGAERDAARGADPRRRARSSACRYTVRIALAAAVVALYVPLTGAGPSIQRAGVMGVAGLVAAMAGQPGHGGTDCCWPLRRRSRSTRGHRRSRDGSCRSPR